nr:hypothetical protein [Tanacetum cinerariifolium]
MGTLIPCIIAGGAGTRLWPVSREAMPKFFMRMPDGESLLQKTFNRASQLDGVESVLTVTNREVYFRTVDDYRLLNQRNLPLEFVLEPSGRNTAPAIAAAALHAQARHGDDAQLLILPADQLINDVAAFGAATGFGYIEKGQALSSEAFQVARFVEKPDAATAQDYVAGGLHLWNAGMFCMRVDVLLAEMEIHAPQVLAAVRECLARCNTKEGRNELQIELDSATFALAPDISIDYALMEHSQKRLVGGVGLDNLIIIDTPDALLIADADRSQEVKIIAQELKRQQHPAYLLHNTVTRPWGTYTVLEEGKRFKIKRIVVKPQASLSLQMHHHRSEHWIVVSGMALVTNNDDEFMLDTNESTFIKPGHTHRLVNPGVIDLVMIEVQSGEYLGEDDIVRFTDVYGRVPEAAK